MSGTEDDREPQDPPPWQTTPREPAHGPPAQGWAPPQGAPAPPSPEGQAPSGATPPDWYLNQPWVAGWQPKPPMPDAAVASLVFGISSLVLCPLAFPAAICLGRRAIKRIDASEGRMGGRTQAKWGVILGWAGFVLTLAMAVLIAVYYATE